MKRVQGHGTNWIVLGALALLVGCGHDRSIGLQINPKEPSSKKPDNVDSDYPGSPLVPAAANAKPVSDRPANLSGAVFVLEYHHLGTSKDTMFRTPDQFEGDLERLYKMGFRPQTVTDYLNGCKNLPKGASPAVFTFDDANPDQVKLNSDGTLAPDCFLGIWQEFAKTHPDFPIRATFFVLPDTMWGQRKMLPQKLALLNKLGCELGNHTMTHPILRKLTDDKVKWEIGEASDRLEKLGVPLPASLALPFGVSPKNKELLAGFDYNGKHVAPKAVFLVGANPALPADNPKFNRLKIPRIQAYDGPYGIKYWLDKVDTGKVKLYVSG